MIRQPVAKFFLVVLLWTCLCLVIFRTYAKPKSPLPLEEQVPAPSQHQLSASSQQDDRNHHRILGSSSPISQDDTYQSNTNQPKHNSNNNNNNNNQRHSNEKRTAAATATTTSSSPPSNPSQRRQGANQCRYDYPALLDLQFNNIHWQKMTTRDQLNGSAIPHASQTRRTTQQLATYYLYNAYYDDRWRGGLPSVRILAMIDRIKPPPTNCLLWSSRLPRGPHQSLVPLVTRATFVYAWYPKWGNYKDGLLQPWIVTCTIPRGHVGLVPESVSLVGVPPEITAAATTTTTTTAPKSDSGHVPGQESRKRRDAASPTSDGQQQQQQLVASIAMPPSFSSSSPADAPSRSIDGNNNNQLPGGRPGASHSRTTQAISNGAHERVMATKPMPSVEYDCQQVLPVTNNLPVYNQRPKVKQKFAVCVKGLDFPHDDVSVRLVEWIEMLHLLGAGKIFLYNLNVHENISRVLHYYQQRGIVELSPLTLPGDQPNLPEYQHLYLKNRLTAKRQNELIPYNDCLYRNLNSYQYLALLDIDEIIMPLRHRNWFDLMQQVETLSLAEQNYSRASYNVRNVYFFDDLSGPLGSTPVPGSVDTSSSPSSSLTSTNDMTLGDTSPSDLPNTIDNDQDMDDAEEATEGEEEAAAQNANQDREHSANRHHESPERGIPHYLHMMSHVYRSKNYTEPGQYVKCFHNTERVVSLHNHFPMNCFGQCTTYSIPVSLAHLQHYRKDCVGPLKQSCKKDFRVFTTRDTTIWKYKQRMIRRTTRVLNHLGLLSKAPSHHQQA